ncbi:MAG: hypothetical protein HY718_06660 [Planctomycetes bacterium]|nr:hypothetical protein [Planctomycetota bacterium]
MVTVDFRFAHTSTRLDDGPVLMAGGQGPPSPAAGTVATAELFFDPTITPPPPGDTVRIKTAQYDLAKRELKVEATSTSSSVSSW